MITCVEKLLHTFVPDLTIGEVADQLPKDTGAIYDVLIHVMITYGALTFAIEDMLKDIKKKADVFESEIASQACGRKASRHEQSVAQRPSSSSRAEVKLEEHDTGSKARESQEIKEEKVERIHPRCKTEEWLDDQKRGRSPFRRCYRVRKRTRPRTGSQNESTVTLRSVSEALEPKSEEEEEERETEREARGPKAKKKPRSRKDLIDYIDPRYVSDKKWKIEFDLRKYVSGAELDMLFREEESQKRNYNHRTYWSRCTFIQRR